MSLTELAKTYRFFSCFRRCISCVRVNHAAGSELRNFHRHEMKSSSPNEKENFITESSAFLLNPMKN